MSREETFLILGIFILLGICIVILYLIYNTNYYRSENKKNLQRFNNPLRETTNTSIVNNNNTTTISCYNRNNRNTPTINIEDTSTDASNYYYDIENTDNSDNVDVNTQYYQNVDAADEAYLEITNE